MPKPNPPVFTTEYGRVICKDGKPYALLAIPAAFFNKTPAGNPVASATPDEADDLVKRIAYLLTEFGEHE